MASTAISVLTYFIVVLVCSVQVVGPQRQHITLYDHSNQTGQNLTIVASKVEHLMFYSFDRMASSACFTGTWLFYNIGFHYQGPDNYPMEYHFGNNSCVNLQHDNMTISLRYVGAPNDYRESSITFYSRINFQSLEAYIDRDLPMFRWNGKDVSFLVTGDSNDSWTLYDRPNYEGKAVCVSPPSSHIPYQPLFICNTSRLNIQHTLFQSVRKGCFAKDTINVNAEASATCGGN